MTLAGLPIVGASEAHLRQVVPAALNGRRCAGAILVARFPRTGVPTMWWFRCGKAALGIARLDGEEVRLRADDGVGAAEALDRADPILRQIEEGLGIELVPEGIEPAAPKDSIFLEVRAVSGGYTRARLFVAIGADVEVLPAAGAIAAELVGHVHMPVRVRIAGPRLPPHEAADLSTGDMILLGDMLTARLAVGPAWAFNGFFDLPRRAFTAPPQSRTIPMDDHSTTPDSGPDDLPEGDRLSEAVVKDRLFSVPLTIELESTTVPLHRLQGLTEGAMLPLDFPSGNIPVRILASGRPLARGTLVSIGEGYGVLIETDATER
jgi:flagellar motor switch protein FliN/FliY